MYTAPSHSPDLPPSYLDVVALDARITGVLRAPVDVDTPCLPRARKSGGRARAAGDAEQMILADDVRVTPTVVDCARRLRLAPRRSDDELIKKRRESFLGDGFIFCSRG